jgi:hypothetical protein
MKKILSCLMLAASVFAGNQSKAQTVNLTSDGAYKATDTVSNTGSKILYVKVAGYKASISITTNVTKISGTLAGTVTPVVSNDGVNFYTVANDNEVPSSNSFTVTDVTAQGIAFKMPKGYLYYGVKWVGTGTMSGSFNGKLLSRKLSD